MGLFDWLTGTKRPAKGVPPVAPDAMRHEILAVNRPTAPFVVRDGTADGVDLVAEWRIVDAEWRQVFADAGLQKVFQVRMRLDPAKSEVRSMDKEWTVIWTAGVPQLSVSTSTSSGQINEKSFGNAYAFTEHGEFGEVYRYRFATGEIKQPLQRAVTGGGWTWRGVAFGKL